MTEKCFQQYLLKSFISEFQTVESIYVLRNCQLGTSKNLRLVSQMGNNPCVCVCVCLCVCVSLRARVCVCVYGCVVADYFLGSFASLRIILFSVKSKVFVDCFGLLGTVVDFFKSVLLIFRNFRSTKFHKTNSVNRLSQISFIKI